MTTIPVPFFSQHLFERGPVRKTSKSAPGLAFAATLYLAVAIIEWSIVTLAAPSFWEIGLLLAVTP